MNYTTSLLVYLSSFGISIFACSRYQRFCKKNNNVELPFYKKILWFLLIIVTPVFISTVRYGIGTDYFRYVVHYNRISTWSFETAWITYSKEPLYYFLQKATGVLFDAEWGFFFISSLIIHLFLISGIDYFKKTISMSLALFIYYFYLFSFGLNGISQMLAMSIIFFSLRYIQEHKFIKFLIFVIIATLLHRSAIVCLVFYIVNIKNQKAFKGVLTNLVYYSAILLSPVLLLVVIRIFSGSGLFASYEGFVVANDLNMSFGFLLYILPILIPMIVFKKQMVNRDYKNNQIFDLILMNIPFQYVGYYIDWGSRMAYYTNFAYIIGVPLLVKSLKNRNNKILIFAYYIIYFIIFYVHKYMYIASSNVFPYQTIFGL